MNTVHRGACSTGEFYDPLKGCQFCSWIQSGYQEILCPCEPFRDAVIGCKLSSNGNNLCRPRTAALEECARRGYTSSVAPHTTTSAGSVAVLSIASSVSAGASTLAVESTQLRSTTAAGIGNPSSSISSDASHLLTLVTVCVSLLVLCTASIVVTLWIRQRQRTHLRQMAMYEGEKREMMEVSAKLIGKDSVAWRGDVRGISAPQVVVINGTTPCGDPKPSSVVNNYHVVVKDSQFTQVGSQNVMNVAEHIASVIGSAGDSNSDEEEQMSCASGSDASGDEKDLVADNALNSRVFWDVGFSHLPAEPPEYTHPPPLVQGGIVDHLEEGNAYPSNLEKSNRVETRTQGFTSLGYSAGRPGEEQATSSQVGSLRTDSRTVPHRSSVAGLSDRDEGPSGPHRCGDESALRDSSSLPTQITDSVSHQMVCTVKAPAAQLAGVSSSSILHGPLPSPAGNQCVAPTVSVRARSAGGVALLPSLTSQTLASLSKGGQCSLDSGDDSNGGLLVHPPAKQSVCAGLLTSPVQNSDKDPKLPLQTVSLHSVPLGVSGGPRQIVAAV